MRFSNDSARSRAQGDETQMKQTISITLNNRFHDAERTIGLFSSTGYRIEKMTLSKDDESDLSHLIVVTDVGDRKVDNFLTRLRQQVRVRSVECIDGDRLRPYTAYGNL